MSSAPPAVSVVMPVHNGERYLREAVDSVLGQTLDDLELVVVDDGSTDGTQALLSRYDDPRLRVLTREHSGIAESLNAGIAAARADLVARMDADDVSRPDRLARQVELLRRRPELAAVGSSFHTMDSTGRLTGVVCSLLGETELRRDLLVRCPFGHGTMVMRRDVVLEAGGYDARTVPAEDWDLWRRIVPTHPTAVLAEPLYAYRVHDGQSGDLRSAASRRVQQDVWATATWPPLGLRSLAAELPLYLRAPAEVRGAVLTAYVVEHLRLLALVLRRGQYREATSLLPMLLLAPVAAAAVILRRLRRLAGGPPAVVDAR